MGTAPRAANEQPQQQKYSVDSLYLFLVVVEAKSSHYNAVSCHLFCVAARKKVIYPVLQTLAPVLYGP